MATAARLRLLRGYVFVCRQGFYWVIGCNDCVQAQARRESLLALLLGWWSAPWGLWTPVVVVQNLLMSARSDDRTALAEALRHLGVALEDIEVGADGMTGRQRQLTATFAMIVGRVAVAAGRGTREWQLACAAVHGFSGGALDVATINRWVAELGAESAAAASARVTVIDSEADRLMMLRAAVEVALADGRLSSTEQAMLERVCLELSLPMTRLQQILDALAAAAAGGRQRADAMRSSALQVLGLTHDATSADVASAHRRLMMRHHPDLVPPAERDEATRRAMEINQARDLLLTS